MIAPEQATSPHQVRKPDQGESQERAREAVLWTWVCRGPLIVAAVLIIGVNAVNLDRLVARGRSA